MINHANKLFLSCILFIFTSFGLSTTASTQEVYTSKGRVAGDIIEVNNYSLRTINQIRELIYEEKYDSAAKKAITFIRSEERDSRNGLEKSRYFKEAYNCLCVSSAALRKVEYAMEACETSLKLNPTNWESLKSRATLHFINKNYARSLNDFRLALENSPHEEDIDAMLKHNISVVEAKLN